MRSQPDPAGGDDARFRQILGGALDGFVMLDAHGVITEWNPQAERIFGYPRAAALQRRLGDLVVPERHLAAHRAWAERGELTEQSFCNQRLETEALHQRGHEIPVELSIVPLREAGGVSFAVFVRDISDRLAAEAHLRASHARILEREALEQEALKRSETSFRALIERLPDGVVVHRGGHVVYVNPAALQMLGYDEIGDLQGHPVLDLVHPDDRATAAQRIAEIERDGGSTAFLEERLVRRDGSVVTAEITGLPITFDGAPAVVALAHDVTEKRKVHAQLAQADRLASMGLLAASVAHEVNNPITYVLLNLERLALDLPGAALTLANLRAELGEVLGPEPAAALLDRAGVSRTEAAMSTYVERIQTANEGARQVGRIARDLKSFARVDNDERGPVNINLLLDRVIEIASNEMRFRAVIVRDYDESPIVLANEGRLSQVMLNLLINAAHAIDAGAPERNTVHVQTRANGNGVQIVISDSGRGIAREHIPRLFDPFFTTKVGGQGSGLGLSICRDIVVALGGRIEVDSTLGAGSRFTVQLPTGSGSAPPSAPPASVRAALLECAPRPRLLLIDDEHTLRSTLATLLSDHYQVVLAESGAAAFGILASDPCFDVILCDLMMPDVSGMQVKAWLERSAPALVPRMVFMTGGAFTRDAAQFLEQAANHYIEKPFEVARLIELLDKVIRNGAQKRSRS